MAWRHVWRVLLAPAVMWIGFAGCSAFEADSPGPAVDVPETGSPDVSPADAAVEATVGADGGADAGPCNLAAPWGQPTLVTTFGDKNYSATFSDDELTMFFDNYLTTRWALYVGTRAKRTDTFTMADEIASPVGGGATETSEYGALSPDGLTLWFTSNRLDAEYHLWMTTRVSVAAAFGAPVRPDELKAAAPATDSQAFVSASGELWFVSDRLAAGTMSGDIFRSPLVDGGYATPIEVTELNSASDDGKPLLSRNGLIIYFSSLRKGSGQADIWSATRASLNDAFSVPVPVSELNTPSDDLPTWLSPDSCRLYITSDRASAGVHRVYVSTRGGT